MPLTLKQLQIRRDSCLERIQELKIMVDDGGKDFENISFNTTEFFNRLVMLHNEEIKTFRAIFLQFHHVLEFSTQAAEEEKEGNMKQILKR